VYLDTEVDATALLAHKESAKRPYSVVSYVTLAVGRVLTTYPQANAAFLGRFRPRIVTYPSVDVKLALDKRIRDERVAVSVVLPGMGQARLDDVQDEVDRLRDSDVARIPELRDMLTMQRLPILVGRVTWNVATRRASRTKWLGTVAVTSLGNKPVLRFFSSGGTALTIGLGQITTRPVVRDGSVTCAPILPLTLTFDHRVLDGGLAADVIGALKDTLEDLDLPIGTAIDTAAVPGA
jgi:pyruvate/2-oxoglutarate dehydrogenase complex dihydrolipoamide acyltransferase (E2) component